jgi:RNAse (barnase) inhibitor barstar
MAWQVAIVADQGESQETLHANLYILLGQMPIWAIAAAMRVPAAAQLRGQWDNCWHPEPALTLVTSTGSDDPTGKIVSLIPTIQEHHPRMCTVRLFGVENANALTDGLANLGFDPISGTSWDGIGFAKPLSQIQDVLEIQLNATGWRSQNHFYDSFFEAVGAPGWHGRNLDALDDSISGGRTNKIELPYRIVVRNVDLAGSEAKDVIKDFADLIASLQANGCPVEMQIEQ